MSRNLTMRLPEKRLKSLDRQLLKKIWSLVRPHWRRYLLAALVMQALNALRALPPLFSRYAIDWYIIPKVTTGLLWLALAFVIVRIVAFGLSYYQEILLNGFHQLVTCDLRAQF